MGESTARKYRKSETVGLCHLVKNVSALSDARFQERVRMSTVLRRAFDKAV